LDRTIGDLTAALGDPTRRGIFIAVRESGEPMTSSDVAALFGIHANVARHHLDKVTAGGYLEVAVARSANSGAGRPSKHYRATTKDVTLEFPLHHDDLVLTLLAKALALLPSGQAESMAEDVGAEYGKAMALSLGDPDDHERSFRDSLHAVAEALTAHGFAAHAERHRDELRIVAEHCPFGDAAIENPVICAVDRGMVKGMLGVLHGEASAALESSLPMGDAHCVTAVEVS
jgi:predicted ArsR family transcriptional regulator